MPVPGTVATRGATTHDADVSYNQQPWHQQSSKDRELAEKLVKRQGWLEDNRCLVDAAWDLIDDIGTGRRSVWDLGERRGRLLGEKTGEKIYDQTTSSAGQDLADRLQGQTAIKGMVWWAAHFRNKLAQKDYIGRMWIDEVEDCSLTEMAQSDMYDQFNEAYLDAVFNGIATVDNPLWLPELGRLHYQTHHPREIFIARDDNGIINVRHRKYPMTMRNIADRFGEENLTPQLRQEVTKNPYSRHIVLHCMYLNTERDTLKWTSENKKVASVYLLYNEKIILRRSGFDAWPQTTWCWRLNSQEDYGRGPAMDVIYESAELNSAMHYLLDAAQLSVQRPLVAQDTLKGKIKISPYGVTWTTGNEGESIRELFNNRSEYPIGMDSIMKMRDELRDKFKAKTFMLLSYLTEMTQRMNMMQIAEIKGEKASILGPLVGRLEFELLCPMINSTVAVLIKNGRAPTPPVSLAQYAQSPVDIEFLGPIAVALRRFVQTQGLSPFLARMVGEAPLMQVWPEMKDKLKPDELFDVLFEADGAPTKVMQDPDTLIQLRQQKAKMAQQEKQMQAAERMAQGYKNTTQAPDAGSPAEQLVKQTGGPGGAG